MCLVLFIVRVFSDEVPKNVISIIVELLFLFCKATIGRISYVMSVYKESVMKKVVALALTGFWLVGLSACSSYPSWVPEWAQIGAE